MTDTDPITVFYNEWYPVGDPAFPNGGGATYATREIARGCSRGVDPSRVAMEFIRIGEFKDLNAILLNHKRTDLLSIPNDFGKGEGLVRSGIYLDARIYQLRAIEPFSGIS